MKNLPRYDSFPRSIVAFRATLLVGLIGVGLSMVMVHSLWGGLLYLLYVFSIFGFVMKVGCARCDYFSARCDLGISVLTRVFVKRKSDRSAFAPAPVRCLVPLALIPLVPMGVSVGAIVLQKSLMQSVLLGVLVFIIAMFVITAKKVTCPRCRMNDICPLGKSSVRGEAGDVM